MRYYFHIAEDGRFIEDEDGQEFSDEHAARKEAIEACASIARDAFIKGTARRIELDVRQENTPVLKIVISLAIEE
jgi:hypothetical protein